MTQMHEPAKPVELVEVFDTALSNAYICLQKAKDESLHRHALSIYVAFEAARNALASEGRTPVVTGNDPHNPEPCDNPELAIAIASVYGFTTSDNHTQRSPHSIQAMKAMQPISAEIHSRGLCIFT